MGFIAGWNIREEVFVKLKPLFWLFGLTLFTLIGVSSVMAAGEEGYTPNGYGGAVWENQYAALNVSEFTSSTIERHNGERYFVQYLNLSWKAATNNVDVIFRFPRPVSGGIDVTNSFVGNETVWNDVTSSIVSRNHNGLYYYGFENVNLVQGSHRSARIRIPYSDVEPGSSLKWDFGMKLSSDSIATALSTGRYILLDPIVVNPAAIDDFEDGVINTTLWKTYDVPSSTDVIEANGYLNITSLAAGPDDLAAVWFLPNFSVDKELLFTVGEASRTSSSSNPVIVLTNGTNESSSIAGFVQVYELTTTADTVNINQPFRMNRSEDQVQIYNATDDTLLATVDVHSNYSYFSIRDSNANGQPSHVFLENFDIIDTNASKIQLNVEFFDEISKIAIPTNVSVTIVGPDGFSGDFAGIGTFFLQPGEYQIIYGTDEHPTRDYHITLTDAGLKDLDLYLLTTGNSTSISFNIKDQNFDNLENATLQALRFYPNNNAYEVVEMEKSSFDGTGVVNLQLNGPLYKFRVIYLNQTKINTIGTAISTVHSTNGLNFQVNTETNSFEVIEGLKSVSSTLVTDPSALTFTLAYTDTSTALTSACLEVYEVKRAVFNIINSSCSTSSSATIVLNYPNSSSEYMARSVFTGVNDDGQTITVFSDQLSVLVSIKEVASIFGKQLLFLIALFISGITLAYNTNTNVAIISGVLALSLFAIAGLNIISITIFWYLFTVAIIVYAYQSRRNK